MQYTRRLSLAVLFVAVLVTGCTVEAKGARHDYDDLLLRNRRLCRK
jgi:hypothetical protein